MTQSSDDDLPTAIRSEEMDFLGYKLTAHVLNTGQRVIEDTPELRRLFEEMGMGALSSLRAPLPGSVENGGGTDG